MEVRYHHAFIDGVDFVFLDHGIFNKGNDIYGGSREVSALVLVAHIMSWTDSPIQA